ncbi:MAG TPA: glycosyltransferase [Gammaproteobacteria bacterium]|nr:glycosyltransferase [Gammaproteobacteria bacterium]
MKISIIIPVYNEMSTLPKLLGKLSGMLALGHELIIVDGGSSDSTIQEISFAEVKVIKTGKGRAVQMNAGAAISSGDILWFLHADSDFVLPVEEYIVLLQGLNDQAWGRFNIRLSGEKIVFRLIECLMNIRSCSSGISTGDQGIFISRQLFDRVNGFSDILIMEDINICMKLKKLKKPDCLKATLITSSRRWEQQGIIATIILMWRMRVLYFMGVSPEKLAKLYEK